MRIIVLNLCPFSPPIPESVIVWWLKMPLFSILQQIYGYEDLHMLQSRLPMVSVFAAHMEQLLLVSCCETLAMIILFPALFAGLLWNHISGPHSSSLQQRRQPRQQPLLR